jgi:hypothetical protein
MNTRRAHAAAFLIGMVSMSAHAADWSDTALSWRYGTTGNRGQRASTPMVRAEYHF